MTCLQLLQNSKFCLVLEYDNLKSELKSKISQLVRAFCQFRSSHLEVFSEKLKNFAYLLENTCSRAIFNKAALCATLFKKEIPVRWFFCEFCEIFESIYFVKHQWTTTSIKFYSILFLFSSVLNNNFFSVIIYNTDHILRSFHFQLISFIIPYIICLIIMSYLYWGI